MLDAGKKILMTSHFLFYHLAPTAFKKIIYHFPFMILDLSLGKIGSRGFSSNDKSKIINGK
jgi:hypothetical protein